MAIVRRPDLWNVDRGYITPELIYRNRREFLKTSGLAGLNLLAFGRTETRAGDSSPDAELRATLAAIPGSSFRPGPRDVRYALDRPMTDELVAARFNNFYEFGLDKPLCWRAAQKLTVRPWTIEIAGLVAHPLTIAIDDLIKRMPCEERLYRLRCVERWAMAIPWSGFAFQALMKLVEPVSAAKYVRFVSFHRADEAIGQQPGSGWQWPYYEGLTIAEAANELTFVATGLYGHDLPKQHGAPLRMVVPWKYGYKGAKSLVRIEFVAGRPKTFWNDYAPREYGFYSNVHPDKPHPRWSQAFETMIGTNVRRRTLRYNGYGTIVAGLYRGDEH